MLLRLHIFLYDHTIYVRCLDDTEKNLLVLSRVLVIVEGIWISESIYWIFTGRKHK
jgi:hypothetical protein